MSRAMSSDTAIPVVSLLLQGRNWAMRFGGIVPNGGFVPFVEKWAAHGTALT